MIYSLRFISREPYEITEVRNPLTGIQIQIYICFLYCYILIFTLFTIFKETAENVKNVVLWGLSPIMGVSCSWGLSQYPICVDIKTTIVMAG